MRETSMGELVLSLSALVLLLIGVRPQCSTIPRLMLSDHADPVTGKRSMWTFCDSCGSCDMVV